MPDLAPEERPGADTRLAPRDRVPVDRRMSRRGWYGGLAMLVVCLVPGALLFIRRPGSLTWHLGPNLTWDVGEQLSTLPGVAALVVLGPLVGYRRRDAVLMTIPLANIYLGWIAGARAVQLRPGDTPQRWAGSHEATRVALLLTYFGATAFVLLDLISVLASP